MPVFGTLLAAGLTAGLALTVAPADARAGPAPTAREAARPATGPAGGSAANLAVRSATGRIAGRMASPAVGPSAQLVLDSVEPAVATGTDPVTIEATVVNTGSSPIPAGRAVARLDTARLRTSAEVADWFHGTSMGNGRAVAAAAVPAVAPGARTRVRLVVDEAASIGTGPYGVIPVSVSVAGTARHTVLGFQHAKRYEPLSLALLVAMTPDPDPQLFGHAGPERTRAWSRALQAGGRLDRLREAIDTAGVTAAIDPTLLGPDAGTAPDPVLAPSPAVGTATSGILPGTSATRAPATGATTPNSPTPNSPGPSGPSPSDVRSLSPPSEETMERTRFAERLDRAVAGRHAIVLPGADADTSSLSGAAGTRMALLRAAATRTAAIIDGSSDVVWPGDLRWTSAAEKKYAAWSPRPVVLTDRASLDPVPGEATAARRSTGGVPLVALDAGLGRALASASAPGAGGAARQELLAESLVVLDESPGRTRTAVAALPRGADVDPALFRGVARLAAEVPWLRYATVDAAVAQARDAPSSARPLTTTAGSVAPLPSPLTPAAQQRIELMRRDARLAIAVREDAARIGPEWSKRLDQLLSTRWRGSSPGYDAVARALSDEIHATNRAVRVAPQTITFLADRGRLQVTVLNDLPVGVRHLQVELVPDSPRLRIDTRPKEISVGAASRASVTVEATALAAGPVHIRAQVLAPDGQPMGPPTSLEVMVSPTSQWVYWALGALALLALAGGLWRHHRAHRRGAGAGS